MKLVQHQLNQIYKKQNWLINTIKVKLVHGLFGANTANEMKVIEDGVEVANTAQKNDSGVAGGVQETKGVVLTHIDSNSKTVWASMFKTKY